MKRISKFIQRLSVVILFVISACAGISEIETVKTSYGKSAYYFDSSSKPVIVLEAGLSDSIEQWGGFLNELSDTGSVFAYNRAGFAGSSSKNKTRDGQTIAAELKELLATAGVQPPFVLVGHSLGGAYMELYAKLYPDDVMGVVLIDPNDARYPAACRKSELGFCDPPNAMPLWAKLFFPKAVSGEIESWVQTHQQVIAANKFVSVPLAVISAGKSDESLDESARARVRLVSALHKQLADESEVSKHLICDTCGHYVHHENPMLVKSAIEWVIENSNVHASDY